ncbi:MAG: EthD domain-containing protein [Actinomycetota bacterium]
MRRAALLVPKPGMSHESFEHYWKHQHGPLVASTPGYGKYRTFYAQSSVVGEGPIGSATRYSGLAEVRLPAAADAAGNFVDTPEFQHRILPDEQAFLDREASVALALADEVVITGAGPAKLIVMSACRDDVPPDEFRRQYLTRYAAALQGTGTFSRHVGGWTAGFIVGPVTSLTGEAVVNFPSTGVLEEFRFADRAGLESACESFADSAVAKIAGDLFAPERRFSFVARERIYFQDGAPMTAAPDPEAGG